MSNTVLPLLVLSTAVFFSGCIPSSAPLTLKGSSRVIREGDIVNTEKGTVITFETLIRELQKARVIYIGEFHTSIANHRMQLRIIEAIHRKTPSMVIAMEMFPRKVQKVLDRWTEGSLSEERFLKETGWETGWGHPFGLYRPILEFAKDHRIKLAGLNAPSEIVKKIARKGLSGLSPSESNLIAGEMETDNADYRQHLRTIYERHVRGEIRDFDTFLQSQLAWDETMAESIARLLSEKETFEKIIVLIGNGHINFHFGVPERAERRLPHEYRTLVSIVETRPGRKIERNTGDYILVIDNGRAPHKGPMGVTLRSHPAGKGIEILHVITGSWAEKAGIRKGDIFLSVNGNPVSDLRDLHHAMAGKGPVHHILVRRGAGEFTVNLTLDKR